MICYPMQLALYVRPAKLLPAFATRVAVTSFSMKGELLIKLNLSPDQPPGISSVDVSFAQPPAFDFNFHTFALAFGDLPFLLDMLKVRTTDSILYGTLEKGWRLLKRHKPTILSGHSSLRKRLASFCSGSSVRDILCKISRRCFKAKHHEPKISFALQELTQKSLKAKMVEPQRLSIDLRQRWLKRSSSASSEIQPPGRTPAEQSLPLGSPAANDEMIEVHHAWRALWPLRHKLGPTVNAGPLAGASRASLLSLDAAGIASASVAGNAADGVSTSTTEIAAVLSPCSIMAVEDYLQPIKESMGAAEVLPVSSDVGPVPLGQAAHTPGQLYANAEGRKSTSVFISAR